MRLRIVVAVALMAGWPAVDAQAALQVVATTTDLKALVEAVGGERVAVTSIVPPNLDAEDYQPRPRDLERLRNANLVVRVGVDYDLWLNRLLAQAANASLYPGAAGHVDASRAVALLEVRGNAVGPGHAHGSGNPHYWLDPANAAIITGTIMDALLLLDPAGGKLYEQRRLRFLDALAARRQEWTRQLAPLRGQPLVAYHNSWSYLARSFRLNIAAIIETKPGVPPSPAHLASVLRLMREQDVRAVIRQPHEPSRNADYLASRSAAKVIVLAASVGAVPQATDYLALFDYNVGVLAALLRDAPLQRALQ